MTGGEVIEEGPTFTTGTIHAFVAHCPKGLWKKWSTICPLLWAIIKCLTIVALRTTFLVLGFCWVAVELAFRVPSDEIWAGLRVAQAL